jgi:hypothetical protein
MPNPWVSLRHDQLNPVNKVVNEKNNWKKGWRRRRRRRRINQISDADWLKPD